MIYVHVCGAVNKPGVYSLPAGSRVADAVLCAGDFSPKAARDYLNLAKKIADGQKIYVPDVEEAETFLAEGTAPEGDGGSISADGEGNPKISADDVGYVDINTAGEEEFMTLPGIGKAKADSFNNQFFIIHNQYFLPHYRFCSFSLNALIISPLLYGYILCGRITFYIYFP